MSTVTIGSARIDENGRATGGAAGDQTGREVSTQSWYKHAKGWRVFRAKSVSVADKIAQDMQWACSNRHIGYDQGQRNTLYKVAQPLGFDCQKVSTNCETDCSALVRVCCAYAGVMLPDIRTNTEPQALLSSGAFIELTGSKYTDSDLYLRRGDILCTKTKGHTVVVLKNGLRYTASADPAMSAAPVPQGLSRGDHGSAVEAMQRLLLAWRPGCLPRYGADGDFGAETEAAVRAYQQTQGLPVTGVYDEATRARLTGAGGGCDGDSCPIEQTPARVVATGDVNVRSAPGTTGSRVLGVLKRGNGLPYQGMTAEVDGRDWYLVEYEGHDGWVSSKYAVLTDAGGIIQAKRGAKIVDISINQPDVDYDVLIADTALIVLRAGYRKSDGKVYIDECFKRHADALTERGVRFGVYFYSIATNEDKAREEARMFYSYAKQYNPLFWAMDAEKDSITTAAIVAFIDELRRLSAGKVGCYVANHLYDKFNYASIRDQMDFTWIPRYGSNRPIYPCDLWQYMSTGSVDGISGNVDLSRITGEGHDLKWFTEG